MFVANINVPQKQCTTPETFDIIFPSPGKNVVINSAGASFTPACGGAGSVPTGSPAQPTTAAAPPSVTTQPALVGGGDVTTSAVSIGSTFTPIGAPSTEVAPAPTQTTFMTVSGTSPAVQPTAAVSTPVAVVPTTTPVASATDVSGPTPSAGSGSGSGSSSASGTYVIGQCDSSKQLIICHSDLSKYSQCYSDNMEYGIFAVPPGTECDSTGMGSFKAVQAVSSRMVKRLARSHKKRSFLHMHNSH